jgi:Chlorite dismutase
MNSRLHTFVAGDEGQFCITRIEAVRGPNVLAAPRLWVGAGDASPPAHGAWTLRGVVSNERYVTQPERGQMRAEPIGRPRAVSGALIPIKKSAAWWALAQDERRAIFEERSRHIVIGMRALPQVARRLHHCRDLPEYDAAADFDFLTWFDFAPEESPAFDRMLVELRATEEWSFVEREVEIRVSRE